MVLHQGSIGKEYMIVSLDMEYEILRRLEALGINEGTKVVIMYKKKKGSLVIKVRGTKWAMGKKITDKIQVREAEA